MDFRGMSVALAVARHGSIRLAARELGLSVSVVSRRLRTFEDGLGVSLFERRPSGMTLTAAGASYLADAARLLDEMNTAAVRARDAGSAKTGRLAIGTHLSASKGLFRDALIRFMQQNARVEIKVSEACRDDLLRAVRRGELDIVLLVAPRAESGLDELRLWKLVCMVALPDAHRLARDERVQWSALAAETFLIMRRGSGPEVRAMARAHLPPGHTARFLEQDVGREAIFNLAGAGLGVAVLPELATGATYPEVVFKPLLNGNEPTTVEAAAYWDPKRDNPVLRRFLALLRASQDPGAPEGSAG